MKKLLFWLFSLIFLWGGPVHAHRVWVVTGDVNANVAEAAKALTLELTNGGVSREDVLIESFRELNGKLATLDHPKLLISMGSDALAAALKWNVRSAVLAGMIPRAAYERLTKDAPKRAAGAMSAIFLDQPIARQAESIRNVFPRAKRVGIVFGPDSQSLQVAYGAALRARNLDIVSAVLTPEDSVFSVVKSSLEGADVFLAVADPAVFNTATIANILLTTYAARVPVVAFSPAYVKAGALYAVYSSSVQIGRQLGGIAGNYLQTGQLPAPLHPFEFSIETNASVARSLGIDLDVPFVKDSHLKVDRRP